MILCDYKNCRNRKPNGLCSLDCVVMSKTICKEVDPIHLARDCENFGTIDCEWYVSDPDFDCGGEDCPNFMEVTNNA